MAVRNIYLRIEAIDDYSPVEPDDKAVAPIQGSTGGAFVSTLNDSAGPMDRTSRFSPAIMRIRPCFYPVEKPLLLSSKIPRSHDLCRSG